VVGPPVVPTTTYSTAITKLRR